MTATLSNPILGLRQITIPVQLAAFSTSAADLVTNYAVGFAGQIQGAKFVTTLAGTGSGATQTFSVKITAQPSGTVSTVTGLSATVTLAGTATTGVVQAFGTMTGATNTNAGVYFDATDTLSISVAAGGTVFTAGQGFILLEVAKLDGQ
jgi:hypothetical protein